MGVEASAIESVYRRRYAGFVSALAAVTGDRESAREAVQEGFAVALRKRDDHRGGSLEAWIWRICLRVALRQRAGDRGLVSVAALERVGLVEVRSDPVLADAIRSLAPRRRLIVFLRYFADFSYAEIAEACAVSEGTVAAALAKARAQLARRLKEEEVQA